VKYRNKEFGFEIEYPENDWESEIIEGQNSGIRLLNRHYLDDAPLILVQGWYLPQIYEDWTLKELGIIKIGKLVAKKRIIRHTLYEKPLEIFIKLENAGVQFLYTGKVRKEVEQEFINIAKTFKIIHEKK